MDIHVFCLCALTVFVVTLGQNPDENKDITPQELLKNTHSQHEQFGKTMMLPLLEKLSKTSTLISKIQSGMAMKASHGTESEFHLNYKKMRSNIASMKVRHSAKSEFELKRSFPSASVAKSSAAQIANSSSEETANTIPVPKQDLTSSSENDTSTKKDDRSSTKQNDTHSHEKADETLKPKAENSSLEINKTQSNKNADKSPEPKSKNSSSEKGDETSTPMKNSSSQKETTQSVEKDASLSQVNSSSHKHTLHIVITHVFHSSLPQVGREFDVANPVHLTTETNQPEVITSTTDQKNIVHITFPGNLLLSKKQSQQDTKKIKSYKNLKEASKGMYKVSMAGIIHKNERNKICIK